MTYGDIITTVTVRTIAATTYVSDPSIRPVLDWSASDVLKDLSLGIVGLWGLSFRALGRDLGFRVYKV